MSLCMLVPSAAEEAGLGPEWQQQGPSSQDLVGLQNANSTPLAPIFTSGDTRIFSQSHPLPLITEHTHPFGLKNPKFQCFFNSVLQLIFSIFRNYSYTSPLNSSTEGTLLKCMLQTAYNACNSKDVDALKFQLVHHDIFYNGQNQQDRTECLLMLINIIDKGSMPDSSSTFSPRGASLSDILFWKNILSAMYVDWGPPHLNLVVCCIFHLLTPLLCKTWF